MSEFRRNISNQETRNLKEWKGGRLSQLKLWVSHLEQAFDVNSLAAQVLQSPKREFSEFVPVIVRQDITTEIEFREIRITWAPPRGLRNFLFYEINFSLTENFAQLDTFVSPDPYFVFPNLLDGTTYYARIRVVTKDQFFGPWSETLEIETPISQGFGFIDGTVRESIVPQLTILEGAGIEDGFVTLFTQEYNAIGGNLYYSVEYEFTPMLARTNRPYQADGEFQWLFDGEQVGQNFLVTAFATKESQNVEDLDVITADIGTHGTDSLFISAPYRLSRRGTFVQKFTSTTAGSHTISIRGRVRSPSFHPTPNDWIQTTAITTVVPIFYNVYGRITFRNFTIFETLVR